MEETFNTLNGLLIRMSNDCEFLFICRLQTFSIVRKIYKSRIFNFVYYNKISLETILISILNNSFDCDLNKRSTRFLANGRG